MGHCTLGLHTERLTVTDPVANIHNDPMMTWFKCHGLAEAHRVIAMFSCSRMGKSNCRLRLWHTRGASSKVPLVTWWPISSLGL